MVYYMNKVGIGLLLRKINYLNDTKTKYYEVIDNVLCYKTIINNHVKMVIMSGKMMGLMFPINSDEYRIIDFTNINKILGDNTSTFDLSLLKKDSDVSSYYYTVDNKHFIKIINRDLIDIIQESQDTDDKIINILKYQRR